MLPSCAKFQWKKYPLNCYNCKFPSNHLGGKWIDRWQLALPEGEKWLFGVALKEIQEWSTIMQDK